MDQTTKGLAHRLDGAPDFTFLTVQLPKGRTLKVEASAMAAMDPHIKMKTRLKGGFSRFLTGESLFINEFTADQADAAQMGQVKGERRSRNVELFANCAGVGPARTRLNQQAKDREASFVAECGKNTSRLYGFHISNFIEVFLQVNDITTASSYATCHLKHSKHLLM